MPVVGYMSVAMWLTDIWRCHRRVYNVLSSDGVEVVITH